MPDEADGDVLERRIRSGIGVAFRRIARRAAAVRREISIFRLAVNVSRARQSNVRNQFSREGGSMSYIDGFVVAVPRNNKEAYKKFATSSVSMFKEFGVTRQVETWGDDVPEGKLTDFKGAVKAKPDEVVVFSWLEYPDKATRDTANKKMMDDPKMKEMGEHMPFDGKRMIFGGFQPINDSGKNSKAGYVDGCLIPVPAGNKDAYRERADKFAAILKEYGATRTVDAWGDDVPHGKVTDYQGAVKAKADETIVFSWVEWPSKEAREKGWEKAQHDPRMKALNMPFDGQRLIYGGFAPILDQ
jgi:uncharacterized protein YbaA (DUF1428 family)